MIKKGWIYPVPGYSTEEIHIYVAQQLVLAPLPCDQDELIQVRKLSCHKVRQMFSQGKIVDAKTICALIFCGIL